MNIPASRRVFLGAAVSFFLAAATLPSIEACPFKSIRDSALVIAVHDGDTVRVRFGDGTERRIRLMGIDSPELGDARDNIRFMALMARRFAYLKLYKRSVRLSYEWPLEDKYGRLLAYITPDGGGLFNEEILREGFASVLRTFPHDPGLMKRFEIAEAEAKKEEKGLWSRSGPPRISPAEVGRWLDRLISVPMAVSSLEKRRGFLVIHPAAGDFEVLIPDSWLSSFGPVEKLAGRRFVVSGLVEAFRGRVQIMVYLPFQLEPDPEAGSR